MFSASPPSLPHFFSHCRGISFSTDLFSLTGAQGCCRGGARGWGKGREGHWGGLPPRAGVYVVFSPGEVGHWALNLHLRLTLLISILYFVAFITLGEFFFKQV